MTSTCFLDVGLVHEIKQRKIQHFQFYFHSSFLYHNFICLSFHITHIVDKTNRRNRLRWSEVCQQICNSCIALRHFFNYRCLHWNFLQHWWKRQIEVSWSCINNWRQLALTVNIINEIHYWFIFVTNLHHAACVLLANDWWRTFYLKTAQRKLMDHCGNRIAICKITPRIHSLFVTLIVIKLTNEIGFVTVTSNVSKHFALISFSKSKLNFNPIFH